MVDLAVGGKGLLERGDSGPVRERPAPEELRDLVEERMLERPVHRREVDERNRWSSVGHRAGRHVSNLVTDVAPRHVQTFSLAMRQRAFHSKTGRSAGRPEHSPSQC